MTPTAASLALPAGEAPSPKQLDVARPDGREARLAPGESALAAAAAAGDRDAFGRLVHAFQGAIFGHLRRLTGSIEDAEDLAQETFLRAYRALASFDPARPFRPWLFAIATNLALSLLRSRRLAVSLDDEEGPGPHVAQLADARAADPARMLDGAALLAAVEAAIPRLAPEAAAVVTLRYREEMSMQQIGDILGRKPGTVAVILHRARLRLRQLVFDESGTGRADS